MEKISENYFDHLFGDCRFCHNSIILLHLVNLAGNLMDFLSPSFGKNNYFFFFFFFRVMMLTLTLLKIQEIHRDMEISARNHREVWEWLVKSPFVTVVCTTGCKLESNSGKLLQLKNICFADLTGHLIWCQIHFNQTVSITNTHVKTVKWSFHLIGPKH